VRGGDALLVVEVAETSLAYDLKTKATLYAAHGVPEYWVINVATLVTTVHTQPSGNTYASALEIAPDALLVPTWYQALRYRSIRFCLVEKRPICLRPPSG